MKLIKINEININDTSVYSVEVTASGEIMMLSTIPVNNIATGIRL